MQKENIIIVAQLLSAIRDGAVKLDIALEKKNETEIAAAKKEILNLQAEIDKLL